VVEGKTTLKRCVVVSNPHIKQLMRELEAVFGQRYQIDPGQHLKPHIDLRGQGLSDLVVNVQLRDNFLH
jgi:hypothetical protein